MNLQHGTAPACGIQSPTRKVKSLVGLLVHSARDSVSLSLSLLRSLSPSLARTSSPQRLIPSADRVLVRFLIQTHAHPFALRIY